MPAKSRLLRIALACLIALPLAAQSTIFVTRHADRFGTEPDPDITEAGEEQAERLGRLLADANLTQIFTTEFRRTQQTAAPAARLAHVQPVIVKQEQFDELIRLIRSALRPGESILVVGHRSTAPRIVKALTGKDVPPLQATDYGRLIAITLFPDGKSSVVTLRYGK